MSLVLSLFPGADLLGRAFREEGWCVVKGPDLIFGEDIRDFHPPSGMWEGVIAGVPCQFWSALAHLVRANGYEPKHGNLFPEFERVVGEAEPEWFLTECAPGSPPPVVKGYAVHSFLWNNAWLGEEQKRKRRFSFGVRGEELRGANRVDLRQWLPQAALELPEATHAVCSRGSEVMVKIGGSGKVKKSYQRATCVAGHDVPPSKREQGVPSGQGSRVARFTEALRLQGLEEDFLADTPFTAQGKLQVVANGVPLPLGRAVARAVRAALTPPAAPGPATTQGGE